MSTLGAQELLILLVVVVVLFGANRLPRLAKNLGQARRELKDGFSDETKHNAGPHHSAKETVK